MFDFRSFIDFWQYDPENPLLFTSKGFLLLFAVFLLIYNLLKKNFNARIIYVTAFSVYFYYLTSGFYFWLLILMSITDFSFGYFIDKFEDYRKKKRFFRLKNGDLIAVWSGDRQHHVDPYGKVRMALSKDGGRTFSPARRLASMDNANARFQIQRLASGRLIFVKHGLPDGFATAWHGRRQLTAYLSDDDGASWQGGLVLDWGIGSYPDLFQAPDGTIYVSHDHGRGKEGEIRLHRFTEEDVLAGKIVSKEGKLLRYVHTRPDRKGCSRKAKHVEAHTQPENL